MIWCVFRYNLDSLKPGPSHVGEFYLSAILYNLIEQGYSVFVIRSTSTSPLPLPNQSFLQRPLNANQFYLTDSQIECKKKPIFESNLLYWDIIKMV